MNDAEAGGAPRRRVDAPRGDPFGRKLFRLCESLAVFGGISLLVITVFTVLSVVGRTGFDLPILGDQEIVELGCAIAIFAFMPYCQMRAANVIVDFFTARFPLAARDFLDAVMNAVFSVCILVVTWRLAVGGIATFNSGDASMFLRIPQWWGYVCAFVGCVFWSLACLYSVLRSVRFMRRGGKFGGRERRRPMSGFEMGLLLFAATLIAIMLRMPIGLAMFFIGAIGYVMLVGWDPLLNTLNNSTYSRFSSYTLSVVPLFLLMGQFATKAGLNRALFKAASAWFGHMRGGLAIASVGGCAMFGAICGSSLATAATMSQVALPEMRRYGYSNSLSTGTLAAGGTLGILIPPSVILVIYAIYTEQSIGHLFLAALIPGIIATIGYMIVVGVYVRIAPNAGPAIERVPLREKMASLQGIWPTALVFVLVVGGIYLGWFSPTEGAAIGAAAVGVLAVVFGGMRWQGLRACLIDTAETTALIFLILMGAEIFNAFLALSQMPQELGRVVKSLDAPPILIIVAMLVIYILLGCVMDALAMVLLTMPVFYPIVESLDLGLTPDQVGVWFGILALMAVEMGLITPPFGLNIFVINAMAEDVPMHQTFKGVLPFVLSDIFRLGIILMVPATALYLPGMM